MPSRKASRRARLEAWIERTRPASIGAAEWRLLETELGQVSGGYLRKLLRETNLPLAPLVEGVRQDSFDDLERTLLALLAELEDARASGDLEKAAQCRQAVVTAKDHARWAARSTSATREKTAQKDEMAQWMLVWLENPSLFPQWLRLRKRARAGMEMGDTPD